MRLMWDFSESQKATSLFLCLSSTISKGAKTNTLCNCYLPKQYPANPLFIYSRNNTPWDLHSSDKLVTRPALQRFRFDFPSPPTFSLTDASRGNENGDLSQARRIVLVCFGVSFSTKKIPLQNQQARDQFPSQQEQQNPQNQTIRFEYIKSSAGV